MSRYTNCNEEQALPFLLEDRVRELGATYVKADEPWAVCPYSATFMTFPLTQQWIRSRKLCILATYLLGRIQPPLSPLPRTF